MTDPIPPPRRPERPSVHIIEHDLVVERTQDGLAAARARGRRGGPKFKMTPTRVQQARAMYDAGGHTVQEIAETFGVSRPTIYRHLGVAQAPATGSAATPSRPRPRRARGQTGGPAEGRAS